MYLATLARQPAPRLAAALAGVVLMAAALLVAGPGAWQIWAFGLGPDAALLIGISRGLERGRLHPRAVPLYNALHRIAGPLALGIASIWLGPPWLAGALAWAAHISADRAAGYGLRTRDGYQHVP